MCLDLKNLCQIIKHSLIVILRHIIYAWFVASLQSARLSRRSAAPSRRTTKLASAAAALTPAAACVKALWFRARLEQPPPCHHQPPLTKVRVIAKSAPSTNVFSGVISSAWPQINYPHMHILWKSDDAMITVWGFKALWQNYLTLKWGYGYVI